LKKFIIAVILLLGIIFIIGSVSELRDIGRILSQGNLWYLLLAIGIEILWLFVFGASFQTFFRLVGIEKKLLPFTRLVAAVNFVNIVAPSAGVSGLAVLYADASRNSYSSARVTVGSLLFILFDYLGLLSVIFIGLIILFTRNTLNFADIVAFLLFLVLVIALAGVLILASRSESRLFRFASFLAGIFNRIVSIFTKRETISKAKVGEFSREIVEGIQALKHVRRGWMRPLWLTLTNKFLLVSILGIIFLAFRVPTNLGVVIAGFSIANLFAIISPTPAGVGIVEGVMTLSLKSLATPLEAAVVVTLAYRAITFWFPLLLGMVSFHTLNHD